MSTYVRFQPCFRLLPNMWHDKALVLAAGCKQRAHCAVFWGSEEFYHAKSCSTGVPHEKQRSDFYFLIFNIDRFTSSNSNSRSLDLKRKGKAHSFLSLFVPFVVANSLSKASNDLFLRGFNNVLETRRWLLMLITCIPSVCQNISPTTNQHHSIWKQ